MIEKLKNFFALNRKERSGALLLMIMIFVLILANLLLPYIRHAREIDYSLFEKEVKEMEGCLNHKNDDKEINVDKQNIYSRKTAKKLPAKMKSEVKKIELNTTDSLGLIRIKGIGPVFSSRIIKYRELLGGFTSINQLLEVYGIDSSKFHNIKRYVKADESIIKRIDLNDASFKQLLKHPYIEYDLVKEIINYRNSNGGFTSVTEIINLEDVDSLKYYKLKPYLVISN